MSSNSIISQNIYIRILTLDTNKILDLYSINIMVVDKQSLQLMYQENTLIKYYTNNYTTKLQYYFTTNYKSISELRTKDFSIILPYGYKYYYDYENRLMYIYTEYLYIPIVFLGSINSLNTITIYVNTLLKDIFNKENYCEDTCTFLNFNFETKTIGVPGSSLTIILYNTYNSLYNDSFRSDYGTLNNFKFEFVNIDSLLKIYTYDYSYYKIKNIILQTSNINDLLPSINVESIVFMIQVLNSDGTTYYNYIVNLNYDLVNYNDIYSVSIYFANFLNKNYNSIKLYVFEYDYDKYFSNLNVTDYDLVPQITIEDAILYDLLISSNNNLLEPTIPSINNYNKNFNKIMIINNLFLNQNIDVISDFLKSSSTTIDLLADYLSNFNIIPYNFWKITTNYSTNINLDSNNFLLNTMLMNVNIFYNIDNNSLNYSLYSELFNNNNKIDLYHKKYILTPENKKQLIKDFIIIMLNYFKIVIYFYKNIEDLDNRLNIFKNTTSNNIYYKFNNFNLEKSDSKIRFNFDQFYNLNITIDLILSYKIIIFKTFKNTITDTILNFKTSSYIFQIFNIPEVNGNISTTSDIYYMVFSNISDCNEFMYFIQTGNTDVPENEVTSFFNIYQSLYFKKNSLTGYYEITTDTTDVIYFVIINLDLTSAGIFKTNYILQQ
jgi:hypothetical protein